MKKILLILIFVEFSLYATSQEKFVEVLTYLSVYNTGINTKLESVESDYFAMMAKDKNFAFKRENIDKEIVFINKHKDISAYLIVPSFIFSKKMVNPDTEYKYTLLFDRKESRCYLIKYYPSNVKSHVTYRNIRKNLTSLSADFAGKITLIIELDKNFNPISGIQFAVMPGRDIEYGDMIGYFVYKKIDGNFKINKIVENESLNIYETLYNELIDKLSVKQRDIYDSNGFVWDLNIESLFEGLESAGIK